MWRDVSRQLGLHKQAVPVKSESTPATGSRSLQRALSDAPAMDDEDASRREEIAAERKDTWAQTQQLRRKFAHVFSIRASTPSDLQKWLESTPCGP